MANTKIETKKKAIAPNTLFTILVSVRAIDFE